MQLEDLGFLSESLSVSTELRSEDDGNTLPEARQASLSKTHSEVGALVWDFGKIKGCK